MEEPTVVVREPEVYRPIENYDNYLVSNYGNIKNKTTGHILKNNKQKIGYTSVRISNNDGVFTPLKI